MWTHSTLAGSFTSFRMTTRRGLDASSKRSRLRRVTFLRVKVKRALVESGIARFLPPHSCAKKLLEHFLLESANNGIFIEHILERRVAFQNLWATIVGHKLRHVTFRIANFRQRLSPLRHRHSFDLLFQASALPFK